MKQSERGKTPSSKEKSRMSVEPVKQSERGKTSSSKEKSRMSVEPVKQSERGKTPSSKEKIKNVSRTGETKNVVKHHQAKKNQECQSNR